MQYDRSLLKALRNLIADTDLILETTPDPPRNRTAHFREISAPLSSLTSAFSKKWGNLWSAYCLHFAYYNFCRTHPTLRITPAMEAGIADHVWASRELLA